TKAAFVIGDDKRPHVNKDLVGKDAAVLAEVAGVRVPADTELLFGETDESNPFVPEEQMMPFVPFVRVPDVDAGIALAKKHEHGRSRQRRRGLPELQHCDADRRGRDDAADVHAAAAVDDRRRHAGAVMAGPRHAYRRAALLAAAWVAAAALLAFAVAWGIR